VIVAVVFIHCICLWLDGGSGGLQMCQYERMQILGIRHPLPLTTLDAKSVTGL